MLPKTRNPDIESESASSEDVPLRWSRRRFSRVKSAVLQPSDEESSDSDEARTLYISKHGVKDNVADAAVPLEKREQRRRMDGIVKDHILDLHVYDKPARRDRKASKTSRNDDFLMSGAIMTGSDLLGGTAPSVTSPDIVRGVYKWGEQLQGDADPRAAAVERAFAIAWRSTIPSNLSAPVTPLNAVYAILLSGGDHVQGHTVL
ncbi:hypothetical protein DL767_006391 [Monosporascus sp. MG133]|nr:hypothetical protein DL767_006391 [Monosporascus sp. MG133]